MKLKIALLQAKPIRNDQQSNLSIGELYCRQAASKGADIALFPEMWNIGYADCPEDPEGKDQWVSQALDNDSRFLRHFKQLAKELEIAIAMTYLERWDGPPRNSLIIYDRHGKEVLNYAKVHTCDFGMESSCTPGDDFYVKTLNTRQGPLEIGAMICYDREFPESSRILMLKGAELILVPNACFIEEHRLHQFKTRAFENMVALAMTNYPAPLHNGHSVCVDGVAIDDQGYHISNIVAVASEGEGICYAELDIARLRRYRESAVWGNAYRKPSRYQALISSEIRHPFIREEIHR